MIVDDVDEIDEFLTMMMGVKLRNGEKSFTSDIDKSL